MTSQGAFSLLRDVRDLQVIDKDGRNCGICDDIEFKENADGKLEVHCLLMGPRALGRRLPRYIFLAIEKVLPGNTIRVPWTDVETVTSRIRLKKAATAYGFLKTDTALGQYLAWIPSL